MQIVGYLVVMIVSVFISMALAPKPQTPQPVGFDEIDFPQIDEGTPQAVFFGECWTGDWQVIGKGDYRTEAVRS